MYKKFFKRFFDFTASLTALLILSPLFVVISIVLLIVNRGSPFFLQERPGYKGKLFRVIKFKSMIDKYDEEGKPLPDIHRITRAGRFLRTTSLDELPQLLNVLKGDMSFIGPRPLLVRYLPYYTPREFKRHEVRPGITGLAQVSGRNFLEWPERLQCDIDYVENLSLKLDVQIFFKTILKVLKRSDIKVIPNGIPFDRYRKMQQEAAGILQN